jgi:hypothetical protein
VPNSCVFAEYQGPILTPAQEAGQVISWVSTLRDSLTRQDQERRDNDKLLGCFPNQLWFTVRELKKGRDEKVIQIHELEEKWSTLDSEQWDMFQEQNQLKQEEKALRREAELLQQDLDQIQQDCFQLQNLNSRQQMETVELHKQVKNLEMALHLEAGIERNLSKAMEGAKEMMELNKEELIRKVLEGLYKGEPQAFQTLYNAMQIFSEEIIMVEAGLGRELKATWEYLQSKHWQATDTEPEERKRQ